MTDLLLITTLDVEGRQNNREHHAIAELSGGYDHVIVVYRQRGPQDRGLKELLRSTVNETTRDGVHYVGVDPFLNPADGAVRRQMHTTGRPSLLRRMLGRAIDTAGVLRDIFSIWALGRAARDRIRSVDTNCEAFGPWAARAAESLRRQKRITHYAYVDRDFEPGFMETRLRRAWAARMERRAAMRADLTLSLGHRLAARFSGLPGARVEISHTGVDTARFDPTPRRAPHADLIFVGEVAPWSGIEEVIDALPVLRRIHPDINLTVLGPSLTSYRAALDHKIEALGLSAIVDQLGQQPREAVVERLSQAGVGLAVFRPHPLRIHAAPLKVMEYMASALPVLALRGSEAGDLVETAGVGLTCGAVAEEIADRLDALLSDRERYCRFSATGPTVAREYDWARIMAKEKALLQALYGAPVSPICEPVGCGGADE